MADGSRILLVEDDPGLAREIVRGLTREAWAVDQAGSLAIAREAVIQWAYRAVLLDRRLPDGDGLELVRIVRARPESPPIIFLTARDEVADRIEGLDAGADDYLVKPFAMGELLARLRVACRRPSPAGPTPRISVGRLTFDPADRVVEVGGRPLRLARRELALLELLVRRVGRVVQRDFLDTEIYGFDAEVSSNALETQVSRLRRRLVETDAQADIRTVRGVGYLLQPC